MTDRFAFCLFCDDARQEVGNKLSLMGIYGNALQVAGVAPVPLLKLVAAVWLVSDFDDIPKQCCIKGVWLDGDEVFKIDMSLLGPFEVEFPSRDVLQKHQISGVIPMSPFVINRDGIFEIIIETDREKLTAGRLHVRIVTPDVVPPSAGSASAKPEDPPPAA